MKTAFLFFVSVAILVSCAKQAEVKPVIAKAKSPLRSAEFLRDSAQFTDSKGSDIDVYSYFLRGKIDWENKKFLSEVTIQFRFKNVDDRKLLLDSAVHKVLSVTYKHKSLPFNELKQEGLLEITLEELSPQEKQDQIEIKIAYEANARTDFEDTGFQIVPPRQDDPVKAKVAFTFAEPESAASWMPCHNTPSDRALFGSEFTVGKGETLISNGDLIQNHVISGTHSHLVSYQTRYTLPTYLMAFAVGEFDVKTLYSNDLPISVVSRHGLRVDAEGLLSRLAQFISHYEKLTVKYPFEKYMLVMLPEFISGGIEHAGITFQAEDRSSQALMASDLSLTAHELAHQWFGDLLTIRTWDDLWIKEGMATLLAEESMRFIEDQNSKGRLFGKNFAVVATEAVIDPALKPDDKYTTGPYDRAGWIYTQLRSHLGEKAFWNMMKQALTENAYGVIGTEELLSHYVTPFAGAEFAAKMRKALFAKTLPVVNSKESITETEIFIEDPDNVLLVPIHFRSLSNVNSAEEVKLQSSGSFKFQKGNLLLVNLGDIHPIHSLLSRSDSANRDVWTALVPKTNEQITYLTALSADQSNNAISYGTGWNISPSQFELFYSGLQSEEAKFNLIRLGCDTADKKDEENTKLWKAVLTKAASKFPVLGMPRTLKEGWIPCGSLLDSSLYKSDWNTIAHYPNHPSVTDTDLLKFANFPGSASEAYYTFKPVAINGATVRAKTIAMMRLNEQFKAKAEVGAEVIPQSEWLQFFRTILMTSELSDVLTQGVEAVVSASDKESLPALKRVIEFPSGTKARSSALCGAQTLLKAQPSEWESFKNSLSSELPVYLKSLLENPEKCGDEEDNL